MDQLLKFFDHPQVVEMVVVVVVVYVVVIVEMEL
jgi:hypothetical protein